MNVLLYLIPVSLVLGLLGLGAFIWAIRGRQYDDIEGASRRILTDRHDRHPSE